MTPVRPLVVKVGTSSLTSASGSLDEELLRRLVAGVAGVRTRGTPVVLVSSGAIAAGLLPLGLARRPRDLATLQAAASVGQGLLVECYHRAFAAHGLRVGQVLLTAEDVLRRAHYRNARVTLRRLLDLGVVPVVNENDAVATEEIRFGDNDRLAAHVAHLVDAERLYLLSDVDAVYSADPDRPGARPLAEVRSRADLEGVVAGRGGRTGLGRGGMASKLDAAQMAAAAGIPVVVGAAERVGELLAGVPVGGTLFHPTGPRAASRLLWLAHASAPRGRLHLDDGAVDAVVLRRLSLLPAGVVGVDGDFEAGDPVELLDPAGRPVARGLAAYSAAALPGVLGRSTREDGVREVVHRDDLVLL
ncbi:MAG: glutamate 5-kinase [Mycobacteriales bacterium]